MVDRTVDNNTPKLRTFEKENTATGTLIHCQSKELGSMTDEKKTKLTTVATEATLSPSSSLGVSRPLEKKERKEQCYHRTRDYAITMKIHSNASQHHQITNTCKKEMDDIGRQRTYVHRNEFLWRLRWVLDSPIGIYSDVLSWTLDGNAFFYCVPETVNTPENRSFYHRR